ncbi:MAG: hypothetical protein K6T30_09555 [Alicyclobacillus sp.]|nr:hypothetical protein [Alicyclobacillus sp.]
MAPRAQTTPQVDAMRRLARTLSVSEAELLGEERAGEGAEGAGIAGD